MSGLRALIVDDEVDILDLLDIWLSDDPRCGGVRRTIDLDEAVDIAREWRPEVVVIDFHIGQRTSVEILPQLRSLCPHARILVHTASRHAALSAGTTAAGADDVVEKNQYSIDALIDRVL